MRRFACCMLVIFLSVVSTVAVSRGGVASLIRKDGCPIAEASKTSTSMTEIQCAIYCQLSEGCKSFYVYIHQCGILQSRYAKDDPNIESNSGCSYYHYNRIDNAATSITSRTSTPMSTLIQSGTTGNLPLSTLVDTTLVHTTTLATVTISTPVTATAGSKEYFYYSEKKSFDDALVDCRKKHSRLVCIHDDVTWQAVLKIIKDNGADAPFGLGMTWIGMNGTVVKSGSQFNMVWADGQIQNENSAYAQWGGSNPDITDEKSCGVVFQSTWNDAKCSGGTANYICEQP